MIDNIPSGHDRTTTAITMDTMEYQKLCYQLKRVVKTYRGFKVIHNATTK